MARPPTAQKDAPHLHLLGLLARPAGAVGRHRRRRRVVARQRVFRQAGGEDRWSLNKPSCGFAGRLITSSCPDGARVGDEELRVVNYTGVNRCRSGVAHTLECLDRSSDRGGTSFAGLQFG